MSDTPQVTFRVEFLTADVINMAYDAAEAEEIADHLDEAVTILGCPDCGNLAPVTGPPRAVPKRMPTCLACDEDLHGVTQVSVVRDDREEQT